MEDPEDVARSEPLLRFFPKLHFRKKYRIFLKASREEFKKMKTILNEFPKQYCGARSVIEERRKQPSSSGPPAAIKVVTGIWNTD